MDNVLALINRRYISLPDDEVRRNNVILESVLSTFITKMKNIDPLFKAMYRRVFYGGSYYDGLKVGRPEEFDLDLLLDIPKYCQPVLTESNIPGYVHLQIRNFEGWMRQPEASPGYSNFRTLFDEDFYLSTRKALSWMQRVVQKTMNQLPYLGRYYVLQNDLGEFKIVFSTEGPALTLHISGEGVKMDVDLVTCFVFRGDKWPIVGYRSNPYPDTWPEFFIVPKMPRNQNPHYWRLSFQEQERALMNDKRTLKPTIKLLKKMRDRLEHYPIASYYIKTVLLHIIALKEENFWRRPLSHVFMTVLNEYKEFLADGEIPYYWNSNNNLIEGMKSATLDNFSRKLTLIIRDIENKPDKPYTVAQYLLTWKEYYNLMGIEPESALLPEKDESVGFSEFIESKQAEAKPAESSWCVII